MFFLSVFLFCHLVVLSSSPSLLCGLFCLTVWRLFLCLDSDTLFDIHALLFCLSSPFLVVFIFSFFLPGFLVSFIFVFFFFYVYALY